MKNALGPFLLLLSLFPALLSAQTSLEADVTQTVTDRALAFSVKIPFQKALQSSQRRQPGVWEKFYQGTDSTENARYIFGLTVLSPGSFLIDDSSYYSRLRTNLRAQFKQLIRDTVFFMKGCFVEDLYGIAKSTDRTDRFMEFRHIERGNSWYTLMADFPVQGRGLTPKVRAFFNSFSMLDYRAQTWHQAMTPDSMLVTRAPTPILIHREDSSGGVPTQTRYMTFDTVHFNSYFISRQQIQPYYWRSSDTAVYADMMAQKTLPTDSLIYKRSVSNGEAKGWEWIVKPRNALVYERQRIFLYGDNIYFLFTYTSKDDITSPNTNRFFEDFRFVRPVPKTHVFDSKTKALLHDLFGPDTARAAAALTYTSRAPFGKEDLPALHSLLLHTPAYQGKPANNRVKATLAECIIRAHDTISFRWAATQYKALTVADDRIKGFLLNIMASFPSPAYYSEMAVLLQASPPNTLPFGLTWVLGAHPHETALIMPQLLSLPIDSFSRFFVIDLAGQLADSNLLTAKKILPFQRELLRFAVDRIAYLSTDYGSPRTTDGALISLLGLLNTDSSNAALREYLEMEFHDERIKAFAALLRNGKQRSEDIRDLAEDKSTRLDLYRVLEKAGRLPLFPVAFRTQKMLSESAVYSAAMQFELEPPTSIDFIDMKVIRTGGASKGYFFYKIKSENGLTHLAFAGPYSQGPVESDSPDATAIYDYQYSFDPVHAQEQISGLLARSVGR